MPSASPERIGAPTPPRTIKANRIAHEALCSAKSVRGEEMTLEDIGRALGCTRERARQLEATGLAKLRAACVALGIDPRDMIDEWRLAPGAGSARREGNSHKSGALRR